MGRGERERQGKNEEQDRKKRRKGGREAVREEEKEPGIKFQSIRLALLLHFPNI